MYGISVDQNMVYSVLNETENEKKNRHVAHIEKRKFILKH